MSARLLITADDLTGALDTGVQFAKKGLSVKVFSLDKEVSFTGAEIVAVNTNSRHLSKEEAYETVRDITERGRAAGVEYFYKKCDSTLRGNIAGELSGMLKGLNEGVIYFIPAYPKMGRTTKGGVHYINGVEISKSVFSKDPLNPIIESDILKMLSSDTPENIYINMCDEKAESYEKGIVVFDCETDSELESIATMLKDKGAKVFAGCAGFAEYITDIADFEQRTEFHKDIPDNLFVVSGSINPVTLAQFEYAENSSFKVFTLSEEQRADSPFQGSYGTAMLRDRIIDELKSNRAVGVRSIKNLSDLNDMNVSKSMETAVSIAKRIGEIASGVIKSSNTNTFIIGGDVLFETLKKLAIKEIVPLGEPFPGVVEFEVEVDGIKKHLFSKAGGFGDERIIVRLYEYINSSKTLNQEKRI